MAKEMITAMSAAQRMGISVAEVEALWRDGKLNGKKEFSQLYVEKESVYAHSGLKEGKQTQKTAGRKPNVMTFEDTATYLSTDLAGVKKLVDEGVLEVVEGAGGVRGPKETQVKMYKKELEKLDTFKGELGGSEVAEETTEEKSVKNENTEDTKAEPSRNKTYSEDNKIQEDYTGTQKDRPSISDKQDDEQLSGDTGERTEFSLDDVMKELFPGIQRLDEKMRDKALGKCKKCEVKYNGHDMKEVADVAFRMGKLSVYESLNEFKRKKPEKLVIKKAKVK